MYAVDLIGASFGCLFVLAGLNYFDAVSFIILSGLPGTVGYFLLCGPSSLRKSIVLFAAIVLLSFLNNSNRTIRPAYVKGQVESRANHLLEKWNSFSRILVFKKKRRTPVVGAKSGFALWECNWFLLQTRLRFPGIGP